MRSGFRHLQLSDRTVIYNMLRHFKKHSDIAIALGVHRSTISREVKRNSRNGIYEPSKAQKIYETKSRKAKYVKQFSEDLWPYIRKYLENGFSPDAIAGRLQFHLDPAMKVSHQTIYNWIHKNIKGNKLHRFLLYGRKGYKRQNKPLGGPKKRRIDEMSDFSRNRSRIGDFEGDLIVGSKQKGSILTLVDRMSSYVLAQKLPDRGSYSLASCLRDLLSEFDNDKLKTLVFDNESGMNDYKSIEEMLQIKMYFAYPGRPWEKPVIENSNRLLRRFFPKKSRLDNLDEEKVRQAVTWLNNYPRKILNYRTPFEVFYGINQGAFAI